MSATDWFYFYKVTGFTPAFTMNYLQFLQLEPYFLLWQEKFLWEYPRTFLPHEFFQWYLEARDWLGKKSLSHILYYIIYK